MWAIAHRGASGYAPENTQAAFELAIALGATAIETDLRVTTDGALVLFHDAVVDRTSDGEGPVDDHSLADLRALDLGGWFGAEFAGERVLTLDELLDEYAARIPLVLEIKDPRATRPLAEAVTTRGLVDRVQITSFWWYPLLEAKALNPALTVGFLTPSFGPALVERIVRRGFAQICPRVDQLTAEAVANAHTRGLTVRAWGITERADVERVRASGADGATVNWPDWMIGQSR